jgi:hypothetical protein
MPPGRCKQRRILHNLQVIYTLLPRSTTVAEHNSNESTKTIHASTAAVHSIIIIIIIIISSSSSAQQKDAYSGVRSCSDSLSGGVYGVPA